MKIFYFFISGKQSRLLNNYLPPFSVPDYCRKKPCGKNAVCENMQGFYKCTCKIDFVMDHATDKCVEDITRKYIHTDRDDGVKVILSNFSQKTKMKVSRYPE